MPAALERIVHRQDEVCAVRNIVVLHQQRVTGGGKDLGDLLGHSGAGAPPADEKVELRALMVRRTRGRHVRDKRVAEPVVQRVVLVHGTSWLKTIAAAEGWRQTGRAVSTRSSYPNNHDFMSTRPRSTGAVYAHGGIPLTVRLTQRATIR